MAAIEAELGRLIRYDDESIVHEAWIRQRYEKGFAASYAPARSGAVTHRVARGGPRGRRAVGGSAVQLGEHPGGRIDVGPGALDPGRRGTVLRHRRGGPGRRAAQGLDAAGIRRGAPHWLASWRADGGDARRFRAGLRDRFGDDEAAAWRFTAATLTPLRLQIRQLARALLVHPSYLPYEVAAAIAGLPPGNLARLPCL